MPEVIDFNTLFQFQPKQKEILRWIGKKSKIVYGGARGGGKTAAAVAIAILCCLQYPGLRVVIIRKSLDELRYQVIDNELLAKYDGKGLFTYNRTDKTAYFPNGSVIYLRSIEHASDVNKEQGIERGLYILDEGNQFEESVIRRLFGSLRAFNVKGWKPTMIITANPGGACDDYIKKYWINPWRYDYHESVYDEWTPDELKTKDEYIFIPAKVYDNAYATEDYVQELRSLPEDLRRAWLEGDWDSFQGQFFPEFKQQVHVCEPFDIPEDWQRWRGIDLGYGKHPSVCLFAAQSPETGAVYIYNEVATKGYVPEFIELIKNPSGDDDFVYTMFDPNSMKGRRGTSIEHEDPATMFQRGGIHVTAADNHRDNGWRNVKAWMHYDGNTPPKLYVFHHCLGLIDTIPKQKYVDGKHDLDTRGQDDYVDALRYILSKLPYGHIMEVDGQTREDRQTFGFARDRRSNLTPWYEDQDDLVEIEGIQTSIFAVY